MKNGIIYLLVTAFTLLLIYGTYWIAKTVSYSIFYESMVEDTIIEMVKQESLKSNK